MTPSGIIPGGTVPSPNIWENPELYELENTAVDPDGVIEAAIDELLSDGASLANAPGSTPTERAFSPAIGVLEGALGNEAAQFQRGWGDVLDVGCGAGFHLPRLAACADSVIGVEPHPGLAARATRRVAQLKNVTVRQGTAQGLPVADASIDLAHARWAYFFGPGCEPGLRELSRVCRRGAAVVVLDHDATRSSVGRWFAAGLREDGIEHDPDRLERFWARNGFVLRRLDVRWRFTRREDLAAVLAIEFPAGVVQAALAEVDERGAGWDVDAAVNLWFRRFG